MGCYDVLKFDALGFDKPACFVQRSGNNGLEQSNIILRLMCKGEVTTSFDVNCIYGVLRCIEISRLLGITSQHVLCSCCGDGLVQSIIFYRLVCEGEVTTSLMCEG